MKLYLVKIGDNLFEYEWVSNTSSILELNNNKKLANFPKLNSDDSQMIKNSGGTICYKDGDIMYWLVNIDHIQDEKIGVILGKELTDIIYNIISGIKRDIKLNSIIE
jgi:hypothetical protein